MRSFYLYLKSPCVISFPLMKSPHRLARSRTPAFHAGNTGSNPVGDASNLKELAFCVSSFSFFCACTIIILLHHPGRCLLLCCFLTSLFIPSQLLANPLVLILKPALSKLTHIILHVTLCAAYVFFKLSTLIAVQPLSNFL